MNKSTLFQPVGGVVLFGIPSRCFPAFLAVWGGQTERETTLCNIKLHVARFGVCVGLLPAPACYVLSLAAGFVFGYGLYAVISRIPIYRWAVLGIKKKKEKSDVQG